MEETVSLKEIFGVFRRHLAILLMSTFVGLALAGGWTFYLVTPQYQSRAQLIVSLPASETGNLNDINFNLQMLNTYKDIILQGDAQATEVKERLEEKQGLVRTTGEIKAALQVLQAQNSQLFAIQATANNPQEAAWLANTTAEVFQETVKTILMNVEEITIVSRGVANPRPIAPNHQLNLAIGLVLGLLCGVFLSFLLELFDRTVKDENYASDVLDLPLLGVVPQMSARTASVKKTQEILHPTPDKKNQKPKRTRKKTRQQRSKV
ncbi:YveK family protein [Enterococcus sp. LJL98]